MLQLSVKWFRPINWLKPQKSFVAPDCEKFSICVRCTVWICNEQIYLTATPPPTANIAPPAIANGRKYISSYFWLHSFQLFFLLALGQEFAVVVVCFCLFKQFLQLSSCACNGKTIEMESHSTFPLHPLAKVIKQQKGDINLKCSWESTWRITEDFS